MSRNRDYAPRTFLLALLVVLLLLAAGFVPPVRVGAFALKRINILSDLFPAEERAQELPEAREELLDTSFLAESIAFDPLLAAQSVPQDPLRGDTLSAPRLEWDLGGGSVPPRSASAADSLIDTASAVPLELFDSTGMAMASFYDALAGGTAGRPVRIAVFGDSFIEADIITADLRQELQELYAGRGAGFVPLASPLTVYRGTIKNKFEGFTSYNIMQKRSTPEPLRDRFSVSGWISRADPGARSRFAGSDFRRHIDRWSVARILFINRNDSQIEVVVNDTLSRTFSPPSDERLQQIVVRGGDMTSVEVKISQPEGFIGYGVVLEDETGIGVDNYSIRSNSGMALFGTDGRINSDLNRMLGFDLIILQYGLNAMSPDVHNYSAYCKQLCRIIDYVKLHFPQSSILVMSVGDRSTMREGKPITMSAVRAMIEAQRTAARQTGVAFWNTFEAMGGENSMVRFVKNSWAAKDYTHIGYAGGRYIAGELVRSLVAGRRSYVPPAESRMQEPLLAPGTPLTGEPKNVEMLRPDKRQADRIIQKRENGL